MIERMLAELQRELALAGVAGRTAERPLAEARDHLTEASRAVGEDAAVAAFGSTRTVARRLAAEIASQQTCGAAFASFVAVAASGIAFVLISTLGSVAGDSPDVASGRTAAVGILAAIVVLVAPQIAFVAGCLAVVRAWRLRWRPAAKPELELLRRRSIIALAGGAVSMVALALYAYEFGAHLAGWWMPFALVLCAGALVPLGAAARLIVRSSRPVAAAGPQAGDVFDDLAPALDMLPWIGAASLRTHATAFVLGATGAICVAATVVRWHAEGDPGSGLVLGVFESVCFLGAYACLRRPLGLVGRS